MRRIIAIVLLLACCIGLFGCHGSQKKRVFNVPAEFDTSRTYEITFWAKNENNKTQQEIYKQAVADFEALYPNIKVNLKLYSDYGTIYKDVITNMATNTTPNVCITYPDHIATYLTGSNTVVPLNDLFTDPKYGLGGNELRFDGPKQSEIIEKFLGECSFNGNYYAIPYMRSTEACYVNKTLVEKLGYTLPEILTWDFIWEVSEAAMKKDGNGNFLVNGKKTMLPFIYKSTDNMMIQMLKQKNAGYSTDNGQVLIFNDTTADLLTEIASHAKTGAFDTFTRSGYPGNFLNRGECIFAVDSTAGATWMGVDAPQVDVPEADKVDFELAIYPVPQFDTENPAMISQGPSICIFNKEDPQEVLASWLFAQFMLTNSVQIAYSQTEGYCPVTTKAQNDPVYQDYLNRAGEDNDLYYAPKIQATQLLLNNVEHSFVTPVFNGSTSLRDAAGHMIDDVNKAVRRKHTVDDAYIQTLFEETTALYRLDQIQITEPVQSKPDKNTETQPPNTTDTTGETQLPGPTDATGETQLPDPTDTTGETQLQTNTNQDSQQKKTPLPTASIILLCSLVGAWICMGAYVIIQQIKRKKAKNQ